MLSIGLAFSIYFPGPDGLEFAYSIPFRPPRFLPRHSTTDMKDLALH